MTGTRETRRNLITSLHLDQDELEAHNRAWKPSTARWNGPKSRAEHYRTDDAEIVLVGYGIVARILKAVTQQARAEGLSRGAAAAHHAVSVSGDAVPAPGAPGARCSWWWR